MPLLDAWKRIAFDTQNQPVNHVWDEYMSREKQVYQTLLTTKQHIIKGSVAELAEKFRFTTVQMCAFLDGIHECVDGLPDISEIEADTDIDFSIEWDRLYRQMVEYKAEPLYTLGEWETIFTKEEQKALYVEQKRSHTVVRNDAKIGRNDPCPCGSGKKSKKCCHA